jgi:hypothetical protein
MAGTREKRFSAWKIGGRGRNIEEWMRWRKRLFEMKAEAA